MPGLESHLKAADCVHNQQAAMFRKLNAQLRRTILICGMMSLSGCGPTAAPQQSVDSPHQVAKPPSVNNSPTATAAEVPLAARFAGKLIDLTHPFDAEAIYWPTEKGFRFEQGNNGLTAKGYYYAANRFAAAEHGGTHLDAPIHFSADHLTADQLPLEQLLGEAAVVDVTQSCAADPDYLIGVADLRSWEEQHQRRLDECVVLLHTGWSQRWPDRLQYLGTAGFGPEAVAQLHFPGLAPEAARWLVEERQIKSIGIDTASIDYGQSSLFETHVILCGQNVPIFENVANLDQLPSANALVIALPMKIAGGSGGPLRIIAVVRE